MELDFILIVAAICIAIGFFIGQLVSSLTKTPKQDGDEAPRQNLIQLWDDPEGEGLSVEIDGNVFQHSSGLDPNQRDRVQRAILALNQWLEQPSSRLSSKEEPAPDEAPTPEPQPAPKTQPRFRFNPMNTLVKAVQADVPKSQLPTESIVEQIDDILQIKLKNSSLKDEGIRLMEWPGKGMVVMVGLERYDGVDDVPSEEIRDLIKSAVRDWEQNA